MYQTEQVAEEDEAEPELPDIDPEEFYEAEEPQEQDDPEQEEAEPQDDADEALHNLAQVLTVTSKKLQATVLGRKFTGRRSIEDRKRSSSCAACGAMGHWAGDSICPVSSKGGSSTSKGSGKNQQKGKDKSRFSGQSASSLTTTSYPKKAFVVNFGDEDQYEDPPGPETFHNFPTNLVEDDANPFVYITEAIDLSGYMVLDTACQKSCTGERWMNTHSKLLQNHGMQTVREDCSDKFQFGAGTTQQAAERCYFPIALPGQETQGVIVGVSVLPLNIPFLASRVLLEQLGSIIDLHHCVLHFVKIGVSIPLVRKHGHIVARITAFPPQCSQMVCWDELTDSSFWSKPSPELVIHPEATISQSGSNSIAPTLAHASVAHQTTTGMADPVEDFPSPAPDVGAERVQDDEPLGASGHSSTFMVDRHRGGRAKEPATPQDGQAEALSEDMLTSGLPTVRKCSRQVRTMQEVRPEVQMDQRAGGLGSILKLITAAIAVTGYHPDNGRDVQAVSYKPQEQGHCQEVHGPQEDFSSFGRSSQAHQFTSAANPSQPQPVGGRRWLPWHRHTPRRSTTT